MHAIHKLTCKVSCKGSQTAHASREPRPTQSTGMHTRVLRGMRRKGRASLPKDLRAPLRAATAKSWRSRLVQGIKNPDPLGLVHLRRAKAIGWAERCADQGAHAISAGLVVLTWST